MYLFLSHITISYAFLSLLQTTADSQSSIITMQEERYSPPKNYNVCRIRYLLPFKNCSVFQTHVFFYPFFNAFIPTLKNFIHMNIPLHRLNLGSMHQKQNISTYINIYLVLEYIILLRNISHITISNDIRNN